MSEHSIHTRSQIQRGCKQMAYAGHVRRAWYWIAQPHVAAGGGSDPECRWKTRNRDTEGTLRARWLSIRSGSSGRVAIRSDDSPRAVVPATFSGMPTILAARLQSRPNLDLCKGH